MQNQRSGKPKNCQCMNTTEIIWMQNEKCVELDTLLNEGTHNFSYIPRKGEMKHQDKDKLEQFYKIVESFGCPIQKSSSIVLFKKKIDNLMNDRSIFLWRNFQQIIGYYNVRDLLDIYYQMDENFVQELIQIWINQDQENQLASQFLKNSQPQNSPLIVKNAYLNYVKNEKGNIMTFTQYINSQEAQIQVTNFIKRLQNLLKK